MKTLIIRSKTHGTHEMYYDDEDALIVEAHTWGILKDPRKLTYYAKTHIKEKQKKDKTVLIHRLLYGLTDRSIQIDHINHNGLDNRRENLRLCNNTQNTQHTHSHRGSFSQYKGVWFDKRSKQSLSFWVAEIKINRKKISLGYFKTERDAAFAYNKAALEYFGEFAFLNDVS